MNAQSEQEDKALIKKVASGDTRTVVLKLGRGVRYRLTDIERLEADAEVRQSGATIGGVQ
jgi:hypothetical protein